MGIIDKLQRTAQRALGVTAPDIQSAKSYGWGPLGGLTYGGYGHVGANNDLAHNEHGAAMAHALSIAAYRAVDARMRAVGSMQWRIVDDDTGKVVDKSTNSNFTHPFAAALAGAYSKHNMPLFSLWELSMCVAGMAFIEPTKSIYDKYAGLEWLNPLAVTVVEQRGKIEYFQYNGKDAYTQYKPDELIYERFPTLLSDHIGLAPLYVAMRRINVSLNTDRFLMAYFRNDARPGTIVSPKDDMGAFSEGEMEAIQNQARALKGTDAAFGTWTFPLPIDIVTLDSPDLSKQVETNDKVDTSIYTALGVPRAVAGDVDNLSYADRIETYEAFFQITVLPRCRDIAGIINDDLLPRFDRRMRARHRFEFDTSQWERIPAAQMAELEIAQELYSSGVMTLNQVRQVAGQLLSSIKLEPLENGDVLRIPGADILVSPDQLGALQGKPSYITFQSPQTTIQQAGEMAQGAGINVPQPPPPETNPASEAPANVVQEAEAEADMTPPAAQNYTHVDNRAAQEDALSELRTWRKYSRKHDAVKTASFETFHLSPEQVLRIQHGIADGEADVAFSAIEQVIRGAPDGYGEHTKAYIKCIADYADEAMITQLADAHALSVLAQKAIQATRIDFEDDVEDLLTEAVAGNIARVRFGNRLRNLVQVAIGKAYMDGLEDGGIAEPELTDDDKQWIGDWFNEQRSYIIALSDAIYKDDRVSPEEAKGKPALWFNKSVAPAYYNGLASASKNGAFEWVLGNAEHCRSCLKLDGQVRRMSYWRDTIMPKDGRLECGGYNCACNLVPSRKSLSRGRLPAWRAVHNHAH